MYGKKRKYTRKPKAPPRKNKRIYKKSIPALNRKVNALVKQIGNPEKKRAGSSLQDIQIGQCNGNLNGYLVVAATPIMFQGAASVQRIGNYIKLVSSHFKYQFQAQANYNAGVRLKIMLIHTVGTPLTTAAIPADMFYDNVFITGGAIIDYNSDRREQTFGTYRVLRTKYVTIPPNNHTGQLPCVTGSFGVKYKNHQIKFFADGSTTIAAGQLTILVLADNGNTNAAASALAGTASTGALTALSAQMDFSHWYYDN